MSHRPCAPLDAIPKALEKTGFLLEHCVAEEFRASGWTVISNRYYVDDVDGRARELDLITYKVSQSDELDVFTVTLVSCKKDAVHTWAFLSKDKPTVDPNLDWDPIHYWTDSEPLASFLGSEEWRKDYVESIRIISPETFIVRRNVFAFQLISADGTAPKNDSPIFDSITGLLKALDHELGALPNRARGKKRLYLLNLVTVVDAPLVDVQYQGNVGVAGEIESLTHLARYMVRKRELSAQVHFVRSDKVSELVHSLSQLADHNFKHMRSLIARSFEAVRTSRKVREYFAKRLDARLRWQFVSALKDHGIDESISSFQLQYSGDVLRIEIDVEESSAKALDTDAKIRAVVKKALLDIVRYDGPFAIEWDIPF